ncbi:MAG: hypothetical protein WDW38_008812 [Sanguina aurantia]
MDVPAQGEQAAAKDTCIKRRSCLCPRSPETSACSDDDSLCNIYRTVPNQDFDYRNKPREVSGMFGVVAADQSRCSDIGVHVLEFKGLELAWKRYGKAPWASLVAPAAHIARHGFAAHPYFIYVSSGDFTFRRLRGDPLMRQTFLKPDPTVKSGWRLPRIGELCCQRPTLADTLDAIGKNGVAWLYTPERLQAMSNEIIAAGGIITPADFLAAEPRIEAPLQDTIFGHTFIFPAPPSSGAVVALVLKIMTGYQESVGSMGLLGAHRMVESMKHGFAVRMALGDPGTPAQPFWNVTSVLADMYSPAFVDSLRASINNSGVLQQGQYGGKWNPANTGISPDDHGTSQVAVVDAAGNAVSLTTTVNTAYGSNVMSPSTGLLFNNQMDDFSKPGAPNGYGLAPAAANFIQPGKRPLSSMSPTIILLGGKLRMVVGASGGPYIITAIIQTVLRALFSGQDPLVAVSQGRIHDQFIPNVLKYESYSFANVSLQADNATLVYLQNKGDTLVLNGDQLGDCQAIMIDSTTGLATAVSDPRKDGAPAAAQTISRGTNPHGL